MVFIEIIKNKAYLKGENCYPTIEYLDLLLSYIIQGSEYSRARKSGRWDGRKRLLSNNLSFPIGLVDKVVEFYASRNIVCDVIHHTEPLVRAPIDISSKLKKINKVPRYYQENAAKVALERKRGIIKASTGSGKTLTSALIIAEVGKPAIVYVIGKDLLYQFHELFSQIFDEEIGIIGDGHCSIKRINIASIWSVGQAFGIKNVTFDEDSPKEKAVSKALYVDIRQTVSLSDVTIMDEVHLAAADTMQKIGEYITSEYCIGMSASPYRDDNASILIEAIFGQVIYKIAASELIEKGYLVAPDIRFLPVGRKKADGTYKEIYKDYIVNNIERNNLIFKAVSKLDEQDFKILVLFKEIAHGKIIYNCLLDNGLKCNILTGSDNITKRKSVINDLETGKCNIILASSIFDIGVDIPALNALVLAGGGKSSIRAIQRVGRVIRPYKGKDIVAIIDFYDRVKYLENHSMKRRKIYETEDAFRVTGPW